MAASKSRCVYSKCIFGRSNSFVVESAQKFLVFGILDGRQSFFGQFSCRCVDCQGESRLLLFNIRGVVESGFFLHALRSHEHSLSPIHVPVLVSWRFADVPLAGGLGGPLDGRGAPDVVFFFNLTHIGSRGDEVSVIPVRRIDWKLALLNGRTDFRQILRRLFG